MCGSVNSFRLVCTAHPEQKGGTNAVSKPLCHRLDPSSLMYSNGCMLFDGNDLIRLFLFVVLEAPGFLFCNWSCRLTVCHSRRVVVWSFG